MANHERIDEYLKETLDNRAHGPVFGGREEELEHIESLYWRAGNGQPSSISTFAGPPGVGKTSLLQEAQKRLGDLAAKDYAGIRLRPPIVLTPETGRLTSKEACLDLCAQYAHENQPGTRYATKAAKGALHAANRSDAVQAIGEGGRAWLEERPFIFLLVDEIQTSGRENGDFYKVLHTGRTTPLIVPVFAGLPDSVQVLEEKAEVTRIDPGMQFNLESLERPAVDRVVSETFDLLEIRVDSLKRWQALAMEASNGFPRHLQSVLKAIASTAKRTDALGAEAKKQVLATAAEDRANYYAQRVNASGWETRDKDIAYEILAGNHKGATPALIAASALDAVQDKDATEEEGKDFVKKMVHVGLIHRKEDRYVPGIPSFTTWLREDYMARQRARAAGTQPPLLPPIEEGDDRKALPQPDDERYGDG